MDLSSSRPNPPDRTPPDLYPPDRDPPDPGAPRRASARSAAAGLALALAAGALSPAAQAHGLWGHIHVTGWAIENLPAGELRDFFADADLRNAAWFGATYTDSGYGVSGNEYAAPAHQYSELTHWEPFIESFIDWIRTNDPPPWTDPESRRRVAFLMGAAAHGLQDEIFDSLFLLKVEAHDGKGQEESDPGTDGFLSLDGYLRLFPVEYVPTATLRTLYPGIAPEVYDEAEKRAISLVTGAYINETLGPLVAAENGKIYEPIIPWARAHYLDPTVMGGHYSEIWPTAAYLDAVWRRLHGDFGPETVVWRYPEPGRRLESVSSAAPESWVTLVFGLGVDIDTIVVSWTDANDQPVPFALRNTRWGETMTRLVRLLPAQDLTPGATYRVSLDAGTRIDGLPVAPWSFEFQAACAEGADCPALAPVVANLSGEGPVVTPWDPPPGADDDLGSGGDADVGEPAPDTVEGDAPDAGPWAEPAEVVESEGAPGPVEEASSRPDADGPVTAGDDLGGGAADVGSAGATASDGGCAAGGGPGSQGWGALLLALLVAIRPRAARPRSG